MKIVDLNPSRYVERFILQYFEDAERQEGKNIGLIFGKGVEGSCLGQFLPTRRLRELCGHDEDRVQVLAAIIKSMTELPAEAMSSDINDHLPGWVRVTQPVARAFEDVALRLNAEFERLVDRPGHAHPGRDMKRKLKTRLVDLVQQFDGRGVIDLNPPRVKILGGKVELQCDLSFQNGRPHVAKVEAIPAWPSAFDKLSRLGAIGKELADQDTTFHVFAGFLSPKIKSEARKRLEEYSDGHIRIHESQQMETWVREAVESAH